MSSEILAERWVNIAVHRRLERGRELFELSDEALDQLILGGPQAPRLGTVPDEAAYFLHKLALKERELRSAPLTPHQALAELVRTRKFGALLRCEVEAAQAWWGKRNDPACAPDKNSIVHIYRDYHYQRDGVWPLFNLWGEERFPAVRQPHASVLAPGAPNAESLQEH